MKPSELLTNEYRNSLEEEFRKFNEQNPHNQLNFKDYVLLRNSAILDYIAKTVDSIESDVDNVSEDTQQIRRNR